MTDVRLAVYDHILATGRVPLIRKSLSEFHNPSIWCPGGCASFRRSTPLRLRQPRTKF